MNNNKENIFINKFGGKVIFSAPLEWSKSPMGKYFQKGLAS